MNLTNETLKVLQHNFIQDLLKKDINVMDRALILQEEIKKHGSMRKFAKATGEPLTNIHEWLLPLKLKKEEQETVVENNLAIADVYTMLGKDRAKKKKERTEETIDFILTDCIEMLSPHRRKFNRTAETKELIFRLKDILNNMEMYLK